MNFSGHRLRGGRPAVSELLATLILIAITLIAGAAVFGFVNGQAGVSEKQYANSVASNINYLNEHFVIVNVQFPSPCFSGLSTTCSSATLSVYNTGSATLNIKSLTVTGAFSSVAGVRLYDISTATGTECFVSTSTLSTTTTSTSTGASVSGVNTTTTVSGGTTTTVANIPTQTVPPVTFTVTIPAGCPLFAKGDSYQFQVLGLYGNTATYQITASG